MARKNPFDLIVNSVKRGDIGVIPTDTIYGIVGSALSKHAVERVYRLRKRNLKKPMIILIGSLDDIKRFGVTLSSADKKVLKRVWPGKVSVVLPVKRSIKKFSYLHRGKKALAFRLPESKALKEFLERSGPIVAPSANFEGEAPARSIKEAKKYFSGTVQFYIDAGTLRSKPSTLIELNNGTVTILRRGAGKV